MTPEELDAALRRGDGDRCVHLLVTATEAERRAAAETVLAWWKAVRAASRGQTSPEHAAYQSTLDLRRREDLVSVCLYGTATWSQIRQDYCLPSLLGSDSLVAVMCARRPDWLAEWAGWVLSEAIHCWPVVRRLVREGCCARPASESYILGMIGYLCPRGYQRTGAGPRVRNGLLADSGLMEYEVWRLFEVEGGGENSLAARDKYVGSLEQWATGLVMLAEEGHLSRERLLTASLEALTRDFAPFRAGWFSRFHEALAPTVAERQARQQHYLALLGSTVPATVSAALKALAILDKEGLLAGETLLDHVAPALFARPVGSVKQALGLIDRVARRAPSLRARAAVIAAGALAHESPEAQAAAFAVIERHGDRADTALREALQAHAEGIAASQRSRLEAWIGAPTAPAAAASMDEARVVALLARAAALPPETAALAGVPAAVRAVRGECRELPAPELDGMRVPRLHPAARLSPISSLEELLDVFAAALENEGPPDEIERVLDGVSRLCAERPADFERRTGPLRKRARSFLATEGEQGGVVFYAGDGVFAGWNPRRDLCGLALAWIDSEWCGAAQIRGSLGGFLSARTAAVAKRALARQPAPLLAAPTHAGGWIDPRVLVTRLCAQPSGIPDPLDRLQALLRLAPDGCEEALVAAQALDGEVGAAVRYALGGQGIPIGPTASLWVAAARARHPDADDPELESRHPRLGPHAGRVPQVELRSSPSIYISTWLRPDWHYTVTLKDVPLERVTEYSREAAAGVPLEFPTVLHHVVIERELAPLRRWAATVWPAGREAWSIAGARILAENVEWGEARWGDQACLEWLLEPDVPLGPMARCLLALGLAATEPGQSGLATDALIAAITDGRLDGPLLGAALAPVLVTGLVKPARWAKTLGEAARISPLHAVVVRDGIEGALRGQPPERPAEIVAFLQLFYELSLQSGRAVLGQDARAYLAALKGSGKAAQLAKALLALPDTPDQAHDRSAALTALEGRLERAERWQEFDGLTAPAAPPQPPPSAPRIVSSTAV